jgi:glycosyltransferase involved in cell wall biosynthesis
VKVSIIIPILNSHEIVRRQVLHFEKIGIPDDTEIILIDDGSTPPIEINTTLPIILHKTNDFREWTWPVARNVGAKLAKGEYFIMVDLDHIVTREFIDIVRNFTGDHVRINREFAVLDENGDLTQDRDVLEKYGLPKNKPLQFNPHRNQFAIHRDLYFKMGGFREDRIGLPYPQREDGDFARQWRLLYEAGEIRDYDDLVGYDKRPILYMFPNGKYCGDVDFNPQGLFHTLTRKTKANRFYVK